VVTTDSGRLLFFTVDEEMLRFHTQNDMIMYHERGRERGREREREGEGEYDRERDGERVKELHLN
jgi:hypothetical protein